ncbi:hypothetical protein EDF56_104230 [Novosphingobium sp. PhB165]|uniref:DUF6118 family protein n=1 Tax=Novosphingobium sp. PhB165 TaxID=2485105 RepID=UPI00104DA187|nr:DUF6118 family protein [Novosphingobium sp. PhB165]TCM18698.1 hypothetical protein EDF56_104230 [Novosphingobium sp. PhB165]
MSEIHTPHELDPAAAFEAMGQRLAGLTAAIDGLAVKFQEMHARDYSPELAKIEDRFEAVRGVVEQLNHHPALALTPEKIAGQIEAAGKGGRLADQKAWQRARSDLQAAATSIDSVVVSARTGEKQKKRMAILVSAALVVGLILGGVGWDLIPRMAPVRWHWREERAAVILGHDKWADGERLLEAADPERWLKIKAAIRSIEDQNAETGSRVERQAERDRAGRSKGHRRRASK